MTVPPPPGHLDLDALADVLAGERTGGRHLRSCAGCQERLTGLAAAEVAVAADLASLPSPPLPDGLSERLAGALRAEAARNASGGRDAASVGREAVPEGAATVTALRSRRQPAAWLPRAAAVVALVLGGGLALRAFPDAGVESPDAASTAAGGGASESAGGLTDGAGSVDYADQSVRPAAVADLLARAADAAATPPATGRSGAPPVPAGADVPAPALAAPGADPVLDRLRDPAALAECLGALRRDGSPPGAPLALDYAAYDAAPALAVVQPDPADPARLVLTVVGPSCSRADPDTRLRTRVPRP